MGFPTEEVICRRDLADSGINTIIIAGIVVVLSSLILLVVNILLYMFTKKKIAAQSANVVEQIHMIMDSVMVCMLPRSLMGKLRGEKGEKQSSNKSADKKNNNKPSKKKI